MDRRTDRYRYWYSVKLALKTQWFSVNIRTAGWYRFKWIVVCSIDTRCWLWLKSPDLTNTFSAPTRHIQTLRQDHLASLFKALGAYIASCSAVKLAIINWFVWFLVLMYTCTAPLWIWLVPCYISPPLSQSLPDFQVWNCLVTPKAIKNLSLKKQESVYLPDDFTAWKAKTQQISVLPFSFLFFLAQQSLGQAIVLFGHRSLWEMHSS